MAKKPIMCVGDANADLIIQLGHAETIQAKNLEILSEGSVAAAPDQIVMQSAGAIGSVASSCAMLGCHTQMYGHTGNDYCGRFVKSELEKSGVDTSRFTLLDDAPSLMVFCLVSPDGERDFRPFPYNGSAYTKLEIEDIPADLTDSISCMFTCGVQMTEQPVCDTVLEMMRRCNEAGVPVVFDINLRTNTFGWDEEFQRRFTTALERSDIIMGSADEELPQVTGTSTAEEAAKKLLQIGDKTVIAKNGSKGCIMYRRDSVHEMGVYPVKVVDTIGAGDSFDGGLLAALYRDKPLEEAIMWGAATAAYTLQSSGAGNRPTWEQAGAIIAANPDIKPILLEE